MRVKGWKMLEVCRVGSCSRTVGRPFDASRSPDPQLRLTKVQSLFFVLKSSPFGSFGQQTPLWSGRFTFEFHCDLLYLLHVWPDCSCKRKGVPSGLKQRTARERKAELWVGRGYHRWSFEMWIFRKLLSERWKFQTQPAVVFSGGIFLIFTNFSCFHAALSKYQCGEVTMHILEPLGWISFSKANSCPQGVLLHQGNNLANWSLKPCIRYESRRRHALQKDCIEVDRFAVALSRVAPHMIAFFL